MGKNRRHNRKNKELESIFGSEFLGYDVSPVFGRFSVAKKDIPKGKVFLKEKWLFSGPRSNASRTCIGCHSDLKERQRSATVRCERCKWFICKPECSTKSPFHTETECEFLAANNIQPPESLESKEFGVITILRGLLLKLYDLPSWRKLMLLEHHNDLRLITSSWVSDGKIVHMIRENWKLNKLFTPEEIYKVCGIMEVNGFEMGDTTSFGGICVQASMIAHDCIPNSSQSENIDDGVLEVVSLIDIPSGSPVTICYDNALKGTAWRREQLRATKYFYCNCARCLDPTECGTNFSSIVCPSCHKGIATPKCVLTNGEDLGAIAYASERMTVDWTCNKCNKRLNGEEIKLMIEEYELLSSSLEDKIDLYEKFLEKCKGIFHGNHYIPFKIKFTLCLEYGRQEGYTLEELSSGQIARKLELCNEVMNVLDILTPGYSVSRGNILYEIQAVQVLISRQIISSGKCSKALLKKKLKKCLDILNESISIFQLHYATRMLAEAARETTKSELEAWIKSF